MKTYKFDGKRYTNISKLNDILHEIPLTILVTELRSNKNTDVCDLIKNEYLRRMNVYTGR